MAPTILVVDDSMVLRASVKFTLSTAGLDVEEAKDGKDGLQVLSRLSSEGRRPAMIISDINMPIMDGITFIKEVKKTDARHVPILVLTTESQPHMKEEGKKAGAAGWLVKPFKDEQLMAAVKKFVRA